MSKLVKWLIRTACGLVGIVVVLLIAGFCVLNTSWLQEKLLRQATTLLQEKLGTNVQIDSVSIDLLTLDAKLYGLSVDDRQQRKMLRLEFLQADVDVWALLSDKIRVSKASIEGLDAQLFKAPKDSLTPDTVANFQFVIDAFKSQKKKDATAKKVPADSAHKKQLDFAIDKVKIERIGVRFNSDTMSLGKLELLQTHDGHYKGEIEGLRRQWERKNKKGQLVSHDLAVTQIEYYEEGGERLLNLNRVNYKTNNHSPRKNANKPKRGFFDVGHFNIWADLKVAVDRIENGTVHGWLRECTAQDTISGIDIRKLQCEVTANKEGMRLEDFQLQQGEGTKLHFVRGDMHFPNKKTGAKFSFFTSTIGGTAILKDISRPFAPVLRNFTLPLNLSVRMEGDAEGLRFRNVVVTRPNGLVNIKGSGFITGLKNKYDLKVHFNIPSAVVKGDEKERIINQFVVRKFMMKQLNALGTLNIVGSFDVLYKLVKFQGRVNTKAGNIGFRFDINALTKYLTGHAEADYLKLGEVMGMPDIGPVTAKADFKFDISKPRTAIMRKKLGGKLPIGEVKAHVDEAKYKFIKVTNLDASIVSNGAIAEGELFTPGKFADISCTFSFTNTNEMHKTKIKPRLRFNIFGTKKTVAERHQEAKEKAARKEQEAKEKAARKEQEAKEKAARKEQEAKEKAARKEQKAKEKAAKKAAKEAEKAAKEAEKAARKAAKEAAKKATTLVGSGCQPTKTPCCVVVDYQLG